MTLDSGTTYYPMVKIGVKTVDGQWQDFDAKIDTGATMTFLSYDDCVILGYVDETGNMKGTPKTFLGVGRHPIHTHVIPLDVKVGPKTFYSIRIAFWDEKGKESDRLLGTTDLFSQIQIAVRGKIQQSFFTYETF